MKKIGLISDTHGYLDDAVFKHFDACDEIWHAGDFGPDVAEKLAAFKPLKGVYGNASLVADDRVIFNVMGNKYRLIVRISFEFKAIQIKWFGTHAQYDKIDVTSVQCKKK